MTTTKITQAVRNDLKGAGLSLVRYSRLTTGAAAWSGDVCGCPDDRCVGHHHEEWEECGCFRTLLADALHAYINGVEL